ncbi:MAG: metallophosphoesterase [Ardenticatenales bacterium]
MPTLIFASDSHLNKHYARMTPDQLAERRARLRLGLERTIDYAIAEGAHGYIHGGDLFDGPNPRAVELVWAARQFQRLADAGVRSFLIGGNHDIPKTRHAGATPQRLFDAVRLATVFTDPACVEWWCGELDGVRVAVGGLPPDPRMDPAADPLAAVLDALEPPDADVRLLVTHYALEDTLHPLAEEPTIRKASIAALAGRVDAVLIGHIHEARITEIAGVKVIFPGPTERLSFGEIDVKCGFVRLDLDPSARGRAGRGVVTATALPLEPQPMRRHTLRATDVPADDPTPWLVDQIRRLSAPDQILQLRLEGPLPRTTYHALHLREAWQVGQDLNFYFDLDRRRLIVDDDDPQFARSIGRVSPRAEIGRVADALADAAATPADRALVEAARTLVLERYGQGAIQDDGRRDDDEPIAAPIGVVASDAVVDADADPAADATTEAAWTP